MTNTTNTIISFGTNGLMGSDVLCFVWLLDHNEFAGHVASDFLIGPLPSSEHVVVGIIGTDGD